MPVPPPAEPAADPAFEPATVALAPAQRFGRTLLAVTSAATMVAAAVGGQTLAPANSPTREGTMAVYLYAQVSHDVARNDWAFQGGPTGRIGWLVGSALLALFWLGVSLCLCAAGRRSKRQAGQRAPWLRVLIAAWAAEGAALALTGAAVFFAERASGAEVPLLLRFADFCSPWWACPAALAALLTARPRTADRIPARTIAAYAAALALLLLVPLPGPGWLAVLILAAVAAGGALLGSSAGAVRTTAPVTPL